MTTTYAPKTFKTFQTAKAEVFDRIEAQPGPLDTPARVRRAVALGLALEGHVLPPNDWARTVRDLTDLWIARESRNPFSAFYVAR